jgi:hypothetical protein
MLVSAEMPSTPPTKVSDELSFSTFAGNGVVVNDSESVNQFTFSEASEATQLLNPNPRVAGFTDKWRPLLENAVDSVGLSRKG